MGNTSNTKEVHWDELYALTKHWSSDLEFYKDDLRFLHHLIDKYFIWITNKENIESVRKIGSGILALEAECKDLKQEVDTHISHLGQLIQNKDTVQSEAVIDEHTDLERHMVNFVKSFRTNRKEVFSITEHVVDSEKLSHLLE